MFLTCIPSVALLFSEVGGCLPKVTKYLFPILIQNVWNDVGKRIEEVHNRRFVFRQTLLIFRELAFKACQSDDNSNRNEPTVVSEITGLCERWQHKKNSCFSFVTAVNREMVRWCESLREFLDGCSRIL